jgi:hypothetical protein
MTNGIGNETILKQRVQFKDGSSQNHDHFLIRELEIPFPVELFVSRCKTEVVR